MLAGDHCKEASDIGLPLVAVGFLYELGYFRQRIGGDGRQEEIYLRFNPVQAAVRETRVCDAAPCSDHGPDGECLFVPVEVGDRTVLLQVWRVEVGRVSLYLMDAHHDKNVPADRELTARLYGGDLEMRIQQEIILGIGGLRVLRAVGIDPAVCHLNEGHSAFATLERARELVESGLPFDEARKQRSCIHHRVSLHRVEHSSRRASHTTMVLLAPDELSRAIQALQKVHEFLNRLQSCFRSQP